MSPLSLPTYITDTATELPPSPGSHPTTPDNARDSQQMGSRVGPIHLPPLLHLHRQHQRLPRPPQRNTSVRPEQHGSKYPLIPPEKTESLTTSGLSIAPPSFCLALPRACIAVEAKRRMRSMCAISRRPALPCRPRRGRGRWRILRRGIKIICRRRCR